MHKGERISLIKKEIWPLLILVLVSMIAYLPSIRGLGYYRDDWNLIYTSFTQGPAKLIDIYSVDRPLIGYLFAYIFLPVFGHSALGWNISAVIIRIAGVLGFYYLLNRIWMENRLANFVASVLFGIYPGFLQLPNGIQYQPHVLNMTLYIFSLAFSIKAIQEKKLILRVILTILSVGLGLLSMLMMEYYIGLEGVRFILLAYALAGENKEKGNRNQFFRHLLYKWAPYAFAMILFLIWRTLFFESQRAGTDVNAIISMVLSSPFYQILRLSSELIKDFLETAIFSWTVPPYQILSSARLRDFLTAFIFGGAGLVLIYFFILRKAEPGTIQEQKSIHESKKCFAEMIMIGILWVLFTSIPTILAGREVTFSSSLDRFTFPGSMGSALILSGFMFYSGWKTFHKVFLLVLVGLGIMTHNINTINFANQWYIARNFWWQLSWRAPTLEKDTVLVSIVSGVPLEEDYEVWGPANIIYYPKKGPLNIQSEVLNPISIQAIQTASTSERTMRTIEVDRDYANTLALSLSNPNSCLHAIDGNMIELSGIEDYRIQLIAAHSNIDRIQGFKDEKVPPEEIFGMEPDHDWCFYYQKASLARQKGDWSEVAALGNEARNKDLRPNDRIEWVPFIQGFAYSGDYDAVNSIIPIIKDAPFIHYQVCNILKISNEKTISENSFREGNLYLINKLCGIE